MSKPPGTEFYQYMGLSENEATKYADILNRLGQIYHGDRVKPVTAAEMHFAKYIKVKLKSIYLSKKSWGVSHG